MRVLVTGFEPFGALTENPSTSIVQELSRRAGLRPADYPELSVAILPTEFTRAAHMIRELLQTHIPDILLSFGVAPRSQAIRLERTARNRDDAALPDNAGEQRRLSPIAPGGPDTFASTLPIDVLLAALEQIGVPVTVSDDAGGYVCNHVFYTARHTIDSLNLPTRCGFVHVPLCTEQVDATAENGATAARSLPLAQLVEAAECCLRVIHALGAPSGTSRGLQTSTPPVWGD